jgi:hypothetical protein
MAKTKKPQAIHPKSPMKGEQKEHAQEAIPVGKAKGAPLKVGKMPTEKVQGGKAVATAGGGTFKFPGGKKGKKHPKK